MGAEGGRVSTSIPTFEITRDYRGIGVNFAPDEHDDPDEFKAWWCAYYVPLIRERFIGQQLTPRALSELHAFVLHKLCEAVREGLIYYDMHRGWRLE
jgi:hypothetical protein